MKKRRLIIGVLTLVLTIAAIGTVVLYKLGDKIFDEIIDNQIVVSEKTMEQPAQESQGTTDTGIAVTREKLEEIKESITPKDKVAAAKIVLSELSKSDINKLTKLSAGGITQDEKAEMKSIVYSKLTPEEIEEVKAMYTKYMK